MKQVINYGIEVPAEFLHTEIPNNLWKVPTTWWEGLPCYLSLDGTKAIIRICQPNRIDNDKGACSWYNVPTIAPDKVEGGDVDIVTELKNAFGDAVMDLDDMNEKLSSLEYMNTDVEL